MVGRVGGNWGSMWELACTVTRSTCVQSPSDSGGIWPLCPVSQHRRNVLRRRESGRRPKYVWNRRPGTWVGARSMSVSFCVRSARLPRTPVAFAWAAGNSDEMLRKQTALCRIPLRARHHVMRPNGAASAPSPHFPTPPVSLTLRPPPPSGMSSASRFDPAFTAARSFATSWRNLKPDENLERRSARSTSVTTRAESR